MQEKVGRKYTPNYHGCLWIIKLGMMFYNVSTFICCCFFVIWTYFFENKKLSQSISSHADISIPTSQ